MENMPSDGDNLLIQQMKQIDDFIQRVESGKDPSPEIDNIQEMIAKIFASFWLTFEQGENISKSDRDMLKEEYDIYIDTIWKRFQPIIYQWYRKQGIVTYH